MREIQKTDICERRVVHCPEHEASHYLTAFVAEHQAGDGTVRLAFRLPSAYLRTAGRRSNAALSLQSMNDLYPSLATADCFRADGPPIGPRPY